MKSIKRLYTKLAIVVLILVLALAAVLLYTTNKTSERYSLEITQHINRDIARHSAEDMPIFKEGAVNQAALKELAHHVMFINPIVEVYLLDLDGKILSHALPGGTVLLDKINMKPLKAFMQGREKLPIFGNDPRNPGVDKVFSISPVLSEGKPAGYLYTVLNGNIHDGLRHSLQESYNLRAGAGVIVGSLFVAMLIGMMIFLVLTKRLEKLLITVRSYRESGFQRPIDYVKNEPPRDELDELGNAIYDMSLRIENQFNALEVADGTRRELIANVSHDLRTPLASMQGYIETLLIKGETLSADRRAEFLEVAHKHSKRLNNLVRELFELSKLESNTSELCCENFSLMELLHDTVQEFTLKASEREVTISMPDIDLHSIVYADIAMIQRVLDNLLDNAIRHTPRGGNISFSTIQEDGRIRVEVTDNGRGISSADIPHIFDRFYRPDDAQPAVQQGNGLGLAIVKRIMELHQSSVKVISEVDHGTSFIFWLPQRS